MTKNFVKIRCYAELNDFLPSERRQQAFTLTLKLPLTIAELIEFLGIPLSEVDLVLVNGHPAERGHPPGARRWRPGVPGCGPLHAPLPDGCARRGRRLPGMLGLQVLRPAHRRLLWQEDYTMPETAQVEVDGKRWNVLAGTFGKLRGPSGAVVYRRCEVVSAL